MCSPERVYFNYLECSYNAWYAYENTLNIWTRTKIVGGNTASYPHVSRLFLDLHLMGWRGCANAMGVTKLPSSCSIPKTVRNQFIRYYICSWRVGIYHFKLRHYTDVIMGTIASQITSLTIDYSIVYSDANQRKKSKLRVTGLCARNSPGTGEFPAQMASYAENVSIWWRHNGNFAVIAIEQFLVVFFFFCNSW